MIRRRGRITRRSAARRPAAAAAALAAAIGLTACASRPTPFTQQPNSPAPSTTGSGTASSIASTPPPPLLKNYRTPPPALPVPGARVTMATGPAPWPAPVLVANGVQSLDYVAAAGLPALGGEMLRVHYHAHLDVIVDRHKVPVPAYLGYVLVKKKVGLAPLHTHDASGLIHVENDVAAPFLLGQVFTEWGVQFTPSCLGGYCSGAGNDLAVFVNGQRYAGDPTRVVLHKHDEIAVVYGATGSLPAPPSSYHFSRGL